MVAGAIAALLGLIEQYRGLRSRAPFRRGRAWIWWLARSGLDFAVGVGAARAPHLFGTKASATGLLGWILLGAAGAAFVRSRIIEYGRTGSASLPVGPAFIYGFVRDPYNGR